jgi:hypothetical protein
MFFFDKLQLLELLRQDDVKTYHAADKITGQDYLLHWLPPDGSPQLARIMSLLNGLDEDARKLVIEVGRRYNRPYLITQNPPTFSGLEPWLHAVKDFLGATSLEKKGAWRIPTEFSDPKPSSPDAPAPSEPGEFTRLMQTLPAPAPAPPAAVPSPAVPPQPAPPQPAPRPPGEFTLFMRQSEPPLPPPKPAVPAGEFTKLMQANPAPAQPERVMRPTPRREASEFTRLFSLPSASELRNPTTPPPATGYIPPDPAQPGEFTRMFQSPAAQPAPLLPREDPFSQPYSPVEASNEFSRNFGPRLDSPPEPLSGSSERATQVFARPPVASAPVPRVPEGPGEYTRMFGTPAVANGGAPPVAVPNAPVIAPVAPPAAAPQARVKSSTEPALWIFVAVLALLAVCAIALIVYFALKK